MQQTPIPELKHKEDFRHLLHDYQISEVSRQALAAVKLVILSGVAGGGRNTVIRYLVEQKNYHFIVSDTSRPPKVRDGKLEQDGIDYFFRSEEDILQDVKDGKFLEAELIHEQQVSGISIRELHKAAESNQTAINEVEYNGANAIVRAKPDTHLIGLLPPSYDEWLKRLNKRELLHHTELNNRIKTAEKVIDNMLRQPSFKIVVNDSVETCAAKIDGIVHASGDFNDSSARQVAVELLAHIRLALAT